MTTHHYRRDIDGLRGIAVLAVVLFHAFATLVPGGFVGVDIFFVISGYLITGILLRDLQAGQFSYRRFYARRVRRIFPALALVLAVTWLIGWFVLLPIEYAELGKHTGAASLFISNFVLWKEAGYFDRAAELKPLLHLWSLGVEEQFYILWPPVLWAIWRWRRYAAWCLAGCFAVSLIANMALLANHPVPTFFLLHARFWQLMLGGLLAYGEWRAPEAMARRFGQMAAVIGLALTLAALACFTRDDAYPGWRALLPTLGATLLIAAGARSVVGTRLLGWMPLVWLGTISYPLYLWHWPLLTYARILQGAEPTVTLRLWAVLLAVLLAWLTCRFVERPLRFGAYRASGKTIGWLVAAMVLLGLIGAATWHFKGLASMRAVDRAMLQDMEKLDAFRKQQPRCSYPFAEDLNWCLTSGNTPPEIAIWGDSHADHLFPGVVNDTQRGWLLIGQSSCPPLMGMGIHQVNKSDECEEKNAAILQALIDTPSIHTVVLAARGAFYIAQEPLSADATGPNDPANWRIESDDPADKDANKKTRYERGILRSIEALEKAGKQVVLFIDVPELDFLAVRCMPRPTRFLTPDTTDACRMPKSTALRNVADYHAAMDWVRQQRPSIRVYDPYAQLCDEQFCYAGRDGVLLYRDSNHLSQRGSQKVMADFIRWLSQ